MTTHKVAIVGCGNIINLHLAGYQHLANCEIAALVDAKPEAAEAFAQEKGLEVPIFSDTATMIEAIRPSIVSLCLRSQWRGPVLEACLKGKVPAIHSEKPMAPSWGEALSLAEQCRQAQSQVTFNHQRRYRPNYLAAMQALKDGAIGSIKRFDVYVHQNIFDMGTHLIDLMFMLNSENPVKWVLAQIDGREIKSWFDLPYEFAAVASLRFENGVHAVIHVGDDNGPDWAYGIRVEGDKGQMEIIAEWDFRLLRYGSDWEEHSLHDDDNIQTMQGVFTDVINGLEGKQASQLSFEHALRATEVIFAAYESSRRRARIDLPLQGFLDNPFLDMLDKGMLKLKE